MSKEAKKEWCWESFYHTYKDLKTLKSGKYLALLSLYGGHVRDIVLFIETVVMIKIFHKLKDSHQPRW